MAPSRFHYGRLNTPHPAPIWRPDRQRPIGGWRRAVGHLPSTLSGGGGGTVPTPCTQHDAFCRVSPWKHDRSFLRFDEPAGQACSHDSSTGPLFPNPPSARQKLMASARNAQRVLGKMRPTVCCAAEFTVFFAVTQHAAALGWWIVRNPDDGQRDTIHPDLAVRTCMETHQTPPGMFAAGSGACRS